MRRRILGSVVLAATAGVGASVLAPMAAHADVACGQTVTVSATLTQDLVCPATAVFINGSNVTFDLGGHTITGPAPVEGGATRGVAVTPNRTGVTVQNGTVRGFDFGVNVAPGANNAVVRNLTLDGNGLGIATQTGSSGAVLTGNTIVNTTRFSAIQLGGTGNRVESNTIANGNGAGVFLSGNDDVITSNRITDMGQNGVFIGAFPSNPGPFVNNQIVGNLISGSGRIGNATSVSVNNGSGTVVQGNSIVGRRATPGVFVLDSANTVVSGNSLDSNSTGVLVRGTSSGTQITGNRSTRNVFSGIAVENGPTGTLVAYNEVIQNGGNGIDVRSPSTTITGNTANYNGNWGIFAVAGVADGGGNKATGNGQPAQCLNVVCTPS